MSKRAGNGPAPLIRLENIHKSFYTDHGALEVLRGISLDIHHGEYLALTGPSGSGKSTLLTILGCLDRPTQGTYCFEGSDVGQLSDDAESRLRNEGIGFVFQSFNLIAPLSIEENVEVPLFYAGVPRADRRRLVVQALERVGLGERLGHRPSELSGGEQQRAAIARALVRNPKFILADEPTGNLDTKTGARILELFAELNAGGKTVLVVTHDPGISAQLPREIRLRDGVIQKDIRRGKRNRK